MVVRIAANLAELRKNLAEGKSQIETTSAAMTKLASSFQGDKLIQAAHNAAAAVQQIGGASRLSEAEQARVNATVTKAIEKYRLLGQEAPSALKQLAEDTKKVEPPTSLLSGAIGKLAAGFTIGMLATKAVMALGNFAREAFASAGATRDLAAATGLSTRTIQEFSFAAKQTGTSVEAFTNAAFKLGTNLAGGGSSVQAAVDRLGLSFFELKQQSPDRQFATVTAALGDMTDAQARNKIGIDLFGKAFKEIAPAVAEGYRDIADSAFIASDAQLESLDTASDALDGFYESIKTLVVQGLGSLIIGLGKVWDTFKASPVAIINAMANALENLGLTAIQMPKVHGPAADALRKTGEQAGSAVLSLEDMTQIEKDLTAEAEGSIKTHEGLAKSFDRVTEAVKKFGGADVLTGAVEALRVLEALGGPLNVLPSQLGAMAAQFKAAGEAARVMGDLELADQYEQLAKTLTPVVQFQQRYNVTIGEFVTLNPSYTAAILEQTSLFEKQADAIRIGVLPNLMNLKTAWVGFKQTVYEDDPGRPIGIVTALQDAVANIPQTLANAFAGGGGIAGALGAIGVQMAEAIAAPIVKGLSKIKQAAVSAGSGAAAALGGAAGGGLGATIGGLAGGLGGAALAASAWGTSMTAAGVSGALALGAATMGIGLAAVGVVMLIKHFGGVSKEIKEARKNLSEFQQELLSTLTAAQLVESQGVSWAAQVIVVRDAYLALGRSEAEALAAVEAMWDTDNPQRSAAAIAEVSAAFAQLEADNDRLTAAMDKYGLSVEDMGHKFKQTQINTTAGEFIEDFRVLAGAVDDVNVVLNKMAPEVNEFINSTIAMGGQVPLEMQGIIAKQIEMGLLFDANGVAITDLTQIPFAASLTDSLTLIVDRLDDLIERIGVNLPRVLANIPDANFDINGHLNLPDLPDNVYIPGFAQGSGGMRDFGQRGSLAILHGREEVRTENQRRSDEASGVPGGLDLGEFSRQQTQMFDGVIFRLEHVLPLRIRDAMAGT